MNDSAILGKYDQYLCRQIVSPVGRLSLYAAETFLMAIEFSEDGENLPLHRESNPILIEAERQILAYFAGNLTVFDLPLLPLGTGFQLSVWLAMQGIPFGETRTYGQIGEKVGGRNKARAVGQAANKNPLPIVIPCHRVMGGGDKLTGFAPGIDKKVILLNHERGMKIW